MVNRITLLLLFIGFAFSQDFLNKSRITEIQDLANKNLELKFKTLAFHSILDIPINFFCGTIVGGFTATTLISSDWLFMGMLVGGTVYPSMKYHKNTCCATCVYIKQCVVVVNRFGDIFWLLCRVHF